MVVTNTIAQAFLFETVPVFHASLKIGVSLWGNKLLFLHGYGARHCCNFGWHTWERHFAAGKKVAIVVAAAVDSIETGEVLVHSTSAVAWMAVTGTAFTTIIIVAAASFFNYL